MPIAAAAIMGGASLLGGSMQSKAAGDAARQSAQAQLESARIAAEAAKFRPVGVVSPCWCNHSLRHFSVSV